MIEAAPLRAPLRWLLPIAALLSIPASCQRAAPPAPLAARAAQQPAPLGLRFSGRIPADRPASAGRGDLDGDGTDDCWSARWEGGSGAGGLHLEVRAPCSAAPASLDTFSSFGSFLAEIELPRGLAERPRLLAGVIDLLFGREHLRRLDAIDGSFRWLVEQRLAPAGRAAPPFASTGRYTPVWAHGAPVQPPSQVILLEAADETRALLAYFTHNHGPLAPVASCGALSVLATHHGVAVHDRARDASSWLYVTTDAVKLRWPSVSRVACLGGLIAIEHGQQGETELFVVSPHTGQYGRLPLEGAYALDARGLTVDGERFSAGELAQVLRGPASR